MKTNKKQKYLTWLNDVKNASTYLRFIFGLSANLGYLGGNQEMAKKKQFEKARN